MSINGHDARTPLGILHLSDLHFKAGDQPEAVLGPLREDLRGKDIHYIVISGDLVDKGDLAAFPLATRFIRRLQEETQVPWERFVLCPGNHDVQEVDDLFIVKSKVESGDDLVQTLDPKAHRVRVRSKYPERFAAYRTLYKELLAHDLEDHLSRAHFFPEHGVQFVALNTCHRIDEYRRKEAGLDSSTFADIIQEADAQSKGFNRPILRIAVWHHAVLGQWCMPQPEAWVERLARNGFALLLHGDVHEHRAQITNPHRDALHIAGAGSLHASDQKNGWCYNFLTIDHDFGSITVQVREQDLANGPFDGHYKFGESNARVDHFLLSQPRIINGAAPPPLLASQPSVQLAAPATQRPTFRTFTSKLPTVDPTLIGRENELAFLDEAWANPNTNVVQIIASGGTGKTALMDKWFRRHLGEATIFGWSFYSQGSSQDRQTSSDPFFAEALSFFQVDIALTASVYAKAEALADKLRQEKVLLLLDGVEPLQDASGEMKDQALKALLQELDTHNAGLALCTTRFRITDLPDDADRAQSWDLDNLSPEASIAYLREVGVKGEDEELKEAAKDYGQHALAITLLGHYLVDFCAADIRCAIEIPRLMVDELRLGQHARRIMVAYEATFAGMPELEILKGLGYFDRPAEPEALKLVLPKMPPLQYMAALKRLRELRLVLDDDETRSLDCHPLIREHFAEHATPECHERLYKHYQKAPKQPDSIAEMSPLLSAVYHGCQAGRHQEVLLKVYHERVLRGDEGYLIHKLGAFGTNLALIANFFATPWTESVVTLSPEQQAWVLAQAAFSLRGLGRLADAVGPMHAGAELRESQEAWKNAAISYGNLSEILLTLGMIGEATTVAQTSVNLADQSTDRFMRIASRTVLADALHQHGDHNSAAAHFREAELLQSAWQPKTPILTSLLGYRYTELLLAEAKVAEVRHRATQTLVWAEQNGNLLSIGLGHLSIARTGDPTHFSSAVDGLRRAGALEFLPFGLLARGTQRDLDEVYKIATRSGMRLHLTDYHLKQAELDLANGNPPKARENIEKAADLIQATGYHRRDPDLVSLRQKLEAQSPKP